MFIRAKAQRRAATAWQPVYCSRAFTGTHPSPNLRGPEVTLPLGLFYLKELPTTNLQFIGLFFFSERPFFLNEFVVLRFNVQTCLVPDIFCTALRTADGSMTEIRDGHSAVSVVADSSRCTRSGGRRYRDKYRVEEARVPLAPQ